MQPRDIFDEIYTTAKNKDKKALRNILNAGSCIDVHKGIHTPISKLASEGNFAAVTLLLKHDANISLAIFGYAIGGFVKQVEKLARQSYADIHAALYGYALGGNKDQVDKLLKSGLDISYAIKGYSVGGHKELVTDLLKKTSNFKYYLDAIFSFAINGDKAHVEELLTQYNLLFPNADPELRLILFGYAAGGRKELANEFLKKHNLKADEMIFGYGAGGFTEQINELLNDENINDVIFAHALSGRPDQVNELLKKPAADINAAICGYAMLCHTNQVDFLLKDPRAATSKTKAIRSYVIGNHVKALEKLLTTEQDILYAIKIYADDKTDHFKNPVSAFHALSSFQDPTIRKKFAANETLQKFCKANNFDLVQLECQISQYEKQKKQNKIRVALVILAAIFVPIISLAISLPLYFWRKSRDPLQEFVTTTEERDHVKEELKNQRDDKPKTPDLDKPKKVFLYSEGNKIVYLADRKQVERAKWKAALANFSLFTNSKHTRIELQQKIQASKEESKKIMQRLLKR